jgi:hypothetical protein
LERFTALKIEPRASARDLFAWRDEGDIQTLAHDIKSNASSRYRQDLLLQPHGNATQ